MFLWNSFSAWKSFAAGWWAGDKYGNPSHLTMWKFDELVVL
jgi:hypothetical protein